MNEQTVNFDVNINIDINIDINELAIKMDVYRQIIDVY